MLSQHDNAKATVVLPVAFDALENIQAAVHCFAPHMESGFFPRSEFAPHIDIFGSLKFRHTALLVVSILVKWSFLG
jgi:hypothetical protein